MDTKKLKKDVFQQCKTSFQKKKSLVLLNEINSLVNFLDKIKSHDLIIYYLNHEKEFFKILDKFFFKVDNFESSISNDFLIEKLKKIFRAAIIRFMDESTFVKHGFNKPKGYPGDYEIVEAMYNNKTDSKDFGFLLDKYFLQNDYVQAVRDRKDRMKSIIKNFIANHRKDKISMLNLACGSCREIRDFLSGNLFSRQKIHLILLDQEVEALRFAKKQIESVPANWKIDFVKDNIFNFLNNKNYVLDNFGMQDLIYSIGLADYLPNSILLPMVKVSFAALNEGGELIIAHKNVFEFSSPVSDWGADWKFIPRTKNGLIKIINESLQSQVHFITSFFDSKKRLFFLIISKSRVNKSKYIK